MDSLFSNNHMDVNSIPSLKSVDYQSLSPHYPKMVLIQASLTLLVPAVIVVIMLLLIPDGPNSFLTEQLNLTLTLIISTGVLLFFGLVIAVALKEASKKKFCLREHDLIFYYGLLTTRHVVQPLLRVQHIEVSQNPLESQWGLATLKLFSAGGFRYTFAIPGLTKDQAERIRQFVVSYQEAHNE